MSEKEVVLKEIVDKEKGIDAVNSEESFSGEVKFGGEKDGTATD